MSTYLMIGVLCGAVDGLLIVTEVPRQWQTFCFHIVMMLWALGAVVWGAARQRRAP